MAGFDFMDQAQAIWKALDDLSERDPNEYRKFISEQLAAGKAKMMEKSVSNNVDGKCTSKQNIQDKSLAKVMEGLSLDNPSSTSMKSEKIGRSKCGIEKSKKESSCEKDANLLDDEVFAGNQSILSGIVKKKGKTGPNGMEDSEEEGITDLVIPFGETLPVPKSKNKIKNKPLIEEI